MNLRFSPPTLFAFLTILLGFFLGGCNEEQILITSPAPKEFAFDPSELPSNPPTESPPEETLLYNAVCGKIYLLENYASTFSSLKKIVLPDFDTLPGSPVSFSTLENFDISDRNASDTLPGVPRDVTQWYGVKYEGKIKITEKGKYQFTLRSSDGSKFFIGGKKVIDNDGIHEPADRSGSIYLEVGSHPFKLEYFKGIGNQIALQLFWRTPEMPRRSLHIVPSSSLESNGYTTEGCL